MTNREDVLLEDMEVVWEKPNTMSDVRMHYCPGCSHGVIHKVLMEVILEMKIQDQTIGVAPVGCSVLAYHYMDIDMQEAAHGRATAVATGIKRFLPDNLVFTYQGDGDLAAIGTAETIHACNRGENFLIIFINNGIYGMTGGQMAPTSLVGMVTSTTPEGREVHTQGHPFKITEMVATLPGTHYVTRQAVHTPTAVRHFKKSLEKAFKYQMEKKGTCLVEIVSNCPSGWKMTPVESNKWIEDNMFPFYPPGDIKVDGKLVEKKIIKGKEA
ncbi:MAG: thiamine pyrophosphate-dependent enzyme [Bacteroidota bacterium]|nr:thiamine pyrophosphate-dependent enzyme [Bacteroidota bacterium]